MATTVKRVVLGYPESLGGGEQHIYVEKLPSKHMKVEFTTSVQVGESEEQMLIRIAKDIINKLKGK